MKSGQKIKQGPPPPPSFGQNPKEQLLFFVKPSLTQSVRYVGIDLLGQLKSKEVSWSKHEPRRFDDFVSLWDSTQHCQKSLVCRCNCNSSLDT